MVRKKAKVCHSDDYPHIDKETLEFLNTLPEEKKAAIRKLIKEFGCKKLEIVKNGK